jgi:O-antigen ligase
LAAAAGYAALGVLVEVGLGTMNPLNGEYRFAGTMHPNGQGVNCAVLCLCAFLLLPDAQKEKPFLLVLLVAGIALLLLTRSRTSVLCLALGVLAVRCVKPSSAVLLGWGLLGVLSLVLLLASLAGIDLATDIPKLLTMGRSGEVSTLTGRTDLWEELTPYAEQRLLLGYGYGAFWSPEHIIDVSSALSWGISAAHSAYLDTILAIGLVGAGLLVVVALAGLWQSARAFRANGNAAAGLAVALLAACLVGGLTESDFALPSFSTFLAACGLCQVAFFQARSAAPEKEAS